MTLPHERRWAITNTRNFLYRLLDPKQTPRVPRSVRREAGRWLKHFPTDADMGDIEAAFGPLVGARPCGCLFGDDGRQTQTCDFHAEEARRRNTA
jgi:hypothetical protein